MQRCTPVHGPWLARLLLNFKAKRYKSSGSRAQLLNGILGLPNFQIWGGESWLYGICGMRLIPVSTVWTSPTSQPQFFRVLVEQNSRLASLGESACFLWSPSTTTVQSFWRHALLLSATARHSNSNRTRIIIRGILPCYNRIYWICDKLCMFYSECASGYLVVRNASTIQNWVIQLIDTSVQGWRHYDVLR